MTKSSTAEPRKLGQAVELVQPQSSPRARKALADLKEAVERLNRANEKGK